MHLAKSSSLLPLSLAAAVCCGYLRAQTPEISAAPRKFSPNDVRAAVVIGIGDYESSSGLGGLKYAAKDAQDIASTLQRHGYAVRLLEKSVTKSKITGAIRDLQQVFDKGKQGTFLFYFAGHGVERNKINFLIPFGVSDADIETDGLSVPDLEKLMRESGARQRALIIDACRHASAAGSRSAPQRTFSDLQASEGFLSLYAAQPGQRSFENDSLQNGIFTHFLVRGLEGEAAREDGLISFFDLAQFVQPRVRQYAFSHETAQHPYLGVGTASGDFVIAIAKGLRRERNGIDGQWYIWVPPGKLFRGCSVGDDECMSIEKPVREVEITKGFWIGESESTIAAWRRYRASGNGPALPGKDSFGRMLNETAGNDTLPAVAMTWAEARDFCGWAQMGLPTEAQWEYAARAGTNKSTYGAVDEIAWFGDNSGKKTINSMEVFREQNKQFGQMLYENGNGAHPVGMKQPNRNGLYDMLGNVWEWTGDWYGPTTYTSGVTEDPTGPLGGEQRIARGGSWSTYPSGVRVSARDRVSPDARLSDIGFRCVGEALPKLNLVEHKPAKSGARR
jgi:formylglycine-generating enzyme required for sulfatase activity